MSLSMTRDEREAFLAAPHVGVLAIAGVDGDALAVPIWYSYEPGGDVRFVTGPDSVKAHLLRTAKRASLCAQEETVPYKYVSIEGPVVTEGPPADEERRAMAYRYLGQEIGEMYLKATENDQGVVFRLTPEVWRTVDYAKQYGTV